MYLRPVIQVYHNFKNYFKVEEVNGLRGTYWYLQNSHMKEGRHRKHSQLSI